MPTQLQFMDCPQCGKRVRTNADRCHHCGSVPAMRLRRKSKQDGSHSDSDDAESHHSAAGGGYDPSQDDFDYEEFTKEEFGTSQHRHQRPWWWYVAWVVLAVFLLGLIAELAMALPVWTSGAR